MPYSFGILIFLLINLTLPKAFAWDASFGITQPQEKVQNRKGSTASNPISPYLAFGHTFSLTEAWSFAPRLGYIKNTVKSDDHYSRYKIETFFLLYDFTWKRSFDSKFYPRLGIGTFLKKTKGEGGTVTVPNGGGFSTAYRPGTSKASATATLNLGIDWKFNESLSAPGRGFGATAEAFIYEILEERKRLLTLSLGLFYYF